MKKFDNPIISIAEFDTHILTLLSDAGAKGEDVDKTAWELMETKFETRAVELTDLIKKK